ncbi:hypothetical protein QOZ80_1BG0085160 [Eleusine coracana subsp. coracana]|nr:hypothetical protein QOZ80_1BG0085160 [Eleusine coracana subsp. coracana]
MSIGSENNGCLRFLRRHPHLDLALLPALLGAFIVAFFWTRHAPPEFSAAVSSVDGLEPSRSAEGPPTIGVTLRATNRYMWRFCFKPGNVEVAYAGVPLARADLPGFCVPGWRGVAKLRVVAAGGGLGLPDALYQSVEAQRWRRERVPLTVRVRLEEDRVVRHNLLTWPPVLLWCEAMLPPNNGPSRCNTFLMGK